MSHQLMTGNGFDSIMESESFLTEEKKRERRERFDKELKEYDYSTLMHSVYNFFL